MTSGGSAVSCVSVGQWRGGVITRSPGRHWTGVSEKQEVPGVKTPQQSAVSDSSPGHQPPLCSGSTLGRDNRRLSDYMICWNFNHLVLTPFILNCDIYTRITTIFFNIFFSPAARLKKQTVQLMLKTTIAKSLFCLSRIVVEYLF